MEIRNAVGPVNGIPPENVFYAVDELGNQCGEGYLVYQFQPHIYPDCPINMYFTINSDRSARYMLFGALIARARMLRESNTNVSARLYTMVSADDEAGIEFYRHNGMDCQETENMMRLQMPTVPFNAPAGCTIGYVPLSTPEERAAFCARLASYDITWVDQGYLAQLSRMPHFTAISMILNGMAIGEILLSGSGNSCEMVALYIHPDYRSQGLGKALIRAAMAQMQSRGVTNFAARLISRSLPQRAIAGAFYAQDIQVMNVFPEKYL